MTFKFPLKIKKSTRKKLWINIGSFFYYRNLPANLYNCHFYVFLTANKIKSINLFFTYFLESFSLQILEKLTAKKTSQFYFNFFLSEIYKISFLLNDFSK